MSILFISGTGTDIGKTTMSLALLIYLKNTFPNKKIAYFKPIQCGTYSITSKIEGGDKDWIQVRGIERIDFYQGVFLQTPASPHYAAEKENIDIDITLLKEKILKLKQQYDIVLIEGAGGILVPLNRKGDFLLDIMPLDTNILLVVSPNLGTINHTLLSYDYLKSNKKKLVGFAMVQNCKEESELKRDNIQIIQELTSMNYWGTLPYLEKLNEQKIETITERWNHFLSSEGMLFLERIV